MKHVAAASALFSCFIVGTIVVLDNTSHGHGKLVRRGPEEESGHQMQSTRLLRRLFMGLGKEKQICNIEIAKPPVDAPIPHTYLASYPGAGAKRVRQFVKALTGLKVQFDYEHEPKPNAVVVQTRFPHKSGMLPPWRKHIRRAVVVIRNPLYALPALFDELYASKKTLPAKFQPDVPSFVEPHFDLGEASVPEWVSWRDRMFESQMVQYREFVKYWITNFPRDSRLVIAYEDIMNEKKGAADAIRLAEFIQEVEEVPRTPQMNEVECIWETLFTHKQGNLIHQSDAEGGQSLADDSNDGGSAPASMYEGNQSPTMSERPSLQSESGQLVAGIGTQSMAESTGGARPMPMGDTNQLRKRRLDSYIIPHPSSMNASLGARPFTIQQLNMMATVLHHLIVELQDKDPRLDKILISFRDENLDLVKMQDGRTFHVFEVTPPGVESHIVPNFLMGLFEPDALSTRLITEPELAIYQNGAQVPLETTIVTQTTHLDLLALYKIFKPGFDEVFFVLSKTGTQHDSQINEEVCEFNNVLCLEPEDQQFSNEDELDQVIRQLIVKFHARFSFYFGPLSNVLSLSGENIKERLIEMNEALSNAAADQSYVNAKFGLGISTPNSGSATQPQGTQKQPEKKLAQTGGMAQNGPSNGRLFYCGSSGPAGNRKVSLLGIYLANAFFPELRGGPPGSGEESATELTTESIKDATTDDFLVFFMHQYCEVNVLDFPGLQLHINHPSNNNNDFMGKFNPPSDNIFVIGPHDEGSHSLHLPYGVMKWYNSVKAMGLEMSKLFVVDERPKSSRENFCLYAETVYADFRELAAHKISQIRPIYAVGSCQGNYQAGAIVEKGRPPKCQPYAYGQQPMEVMLPQNLNREVVVAKKSISNTFRFIIVIEDANIPGYITERIFDAFLSGAIPIYYGSTEVFGIFNPKAFIFYDITYPDAALELISSLERNPDAYEQMINEPILANGQRTIEKYFSFEDIIGNGALKQRVRKKLGFEL